MWLTFLFVIQYLCHYQEKTIIIPVECLWLMDGLSSLTWPESDWLHSGACWGCTHTHSCALDYQAHRLNQPSPRTLRSLTWQHGTPALRVTWFKLYNKRSTNHQPVCRSSPAKPLMCCVWHGETDIISITIYFHLPSAATTGSYAIYFSWRSLCCVTFGEQLRRKKWENCQVFKSCWAAFRSIGHR